MDQNTIDIICESKHVDCDSIIKSFALDKPLKYQEINDNSEDSLYTILSCIYDDVQNAPQQDPASNQIFDVNGSDTIHYNKQIRDDDFGQNGIARRQGYEIYDDCTVRDVEFVLKKMMTPTLSGISYVFGTQFVQRQDIVVYKDFGDLQTHQGLFEQIRKYKNLILRCVMHLYAQHISQDNNSDRAFARIIEVIKVPDV